MASANRYPGIDPRVVACVRHHASRVCGSISEMEIEDIEQELMLHVHRRLPHFDPTRGSLRTFADPIARSCVANLVQAAHAQKRGLGFEILSLEAMAFNGDNGSSPICGEHRVVLHAEQQVGFSPEAFLNLRIDLWRAFGRLPSTLRSCFLKLFDNTVTDAARRAGVSRATVYDQIAAIRELFRAVDLQAYATEPDTFEVFSVSERHALRLREAGRRQEERSCRRRLRDVS
jgi:DNA-directed RNA polymerase specialized sigma24 family protein